MIKVYRRVLLLFIKNLSIVNVYLFYLIYDIIIFTLYVLKNII